MRTLYLHIGFPKTGTTTFQRHLFPDLTGIRYLGRFNGLKDTELRVVDKFIGSLHFGPDEMVNLHSDKVNSFIKSQEEKLYGEINCDQPLFISHEGFTALFFLPHDLDHYGLWFSDPGVVFKRLKNFSVKYDYDLQIILTKREPKELIHSMYAQFYYRYRQIKLLDTLEKLLGCISSDEFENNFKLLFKDNMSNEIKKYFKKDCVHEWRFKEIFMRKDISDIEHTFRSMGKIPELTQENKRSVDKITKYGDIRPFWIKSNSLFKSLLKARKSFYYYYNSGMKNRKAIVWEKQFDTYIDKLS